VNATRSLRRRRLGGALIILLLWPALAAAANVVVTENANPGTADWLITSPATNHEIEGYASAPSVNRGGTLELFVNTAEPSYLLEVFRLGWYQGLGGRRLLATWKAGMLQPPPVLDPATGLIECRWAPSHVLRIASYENAVAWPSGAYVVKLTAGSSGRQSYIPFIVRAGVRSSTYVFQSSVTTWQAYNNWGGKSLYAYNSTGRHAVKVSFERPYAQGHGSGHLVWPWGSWELNMLRFLEREGLDVTYTTNVDVHQDAALARHRAFLSVGHDEYWSWEMRRNVESARDAGVSLGFFGANACFWQIRFEASPATARPDRVIVGYKYDYTSDPFFTDGDPSNDRRVTTQWRLPPVSLPEDAMIGVAYVYDPVDADIVVENSGHWVYAGTGLRDGDRLEGLLGYEVDALLGHAPAGTVRLANSPFPLDDGTTAYSHMSLYTTPGGATVFATGSIFWSWGLDDLFGGSEHPLLVSAAVQQITRNVLRRMARP
jgi:hypothetical protein